MTAGRFALAVLLLVVISGCRSGIPPATVSACFLAGDRIVPVTLEMADTPEQRQKGLMERTQLGAKQGMWFLYPEQRRGDQGFWMYQTRIPLDIAFLDRQGVVLRILSMEPCKASHSAHCPTYIPGVPYRSAVEMNAGFYRAHRIGEGARLSADASLCRR